MLASSMKKEQETGGKAVFQWHSISIFCACSIGLCCGDPAELTAVPLLPQVHKAASLMSLWVSTLDPLCAEGNGRLSQPFNAVN